MSSNPLRNPSTSDVTVPLVKNPGAGSQCWEGKFPSPVRVYDAVKPKFIDKTP